MNSHYKYFILKTDSVGPYFKMSAEMFVCMIHCTCLKAASADTIKIVAQLIQSKQRDFTIKIMNIQKQTNQVDCGLYSIAVLTSLLLGDDPTILVYNKDELRSHLLTVLETKIISPIPISQTRRPATRVAEIEHCSVFCSCRLPDNGESMICCDSCKEWFHF